VIASILKNFITLASAEAFSKLVIFAAFAYLARLLGPNGFGIVEWSVALLMCAGMIVEQGLGSYGAREIASKPSDTPILLREIVLLRFGLAGIAYVAVLAFAVKATQDANVSQLVLIYGISLWLMPFSLIWVFQGHKRMALVALMQITRYSVFAFIVFVFVRNNADLYLVAWAEVLAVSAAALLSVALYIRLFRSSENISVRGLHPMDTLVEALPIGLSQMLWVLKYFGATLIVGLMASAEQTGYFGASMRIFIALHTFVWLYYFNMLPSMATIWKTSPKAFWRLIHRSMQFLVPVCVVVIAIWMFGSRMAMSLAFGQSFSDGATTLQWLCGVWVAAAISGHYRFGLIAAGYQRHELLTSAVGAFLAVVFIPVGFHSWGIAGAAAGLFFAEIMVLGSSWLFAERLLSVGNRSISFHEKVLTDAAGVAQ
jgi:O-antigen/teichoic acid export membrane protein